MTLEKPLSNLYKQYSRGDLSKKDFEGKIFQYLLNHIDRYHLFDGNRERWEDYLSWLYPRLSRAIDVYHDIGSSFDAYISGLINGASKEYRYREADHYITEYACWQARAEELKLHENEPEYSEDRGKTSAPIQLKPRQILLLLLKSYFFVSEDLIRQVARATGIEADEIVSMIEKMRERRSGKEAETLDLIDRIHCQYYRCLAYQKRMSSSAQGSEYHDRMKGLFERAMKRFYAMRKRLGKIRMAASNQMIAEVLGIPRGTVDSGLSAIKHRWLPSMDKANTDKANKNEAV